MMIAVIYRYITVNYGIDMDALANGDYPTVVSCIDWLVTTSLIVNKFSELNGGEDASAVAMLVFVADVMMMMMMMMMILFGFLGEISINATNSGGSLLIGWSMFGASCLAWLFTIFLHTAVTNASVNKLASIHVRLSRLKLFIVIGWAIYLLGLLITLVSNTSDMRISRKLIRNFADLFNKVGFGIGAIYAIRQVMRDARIRDAKAAF